MAKLITIYWRDIPAQVIARVGRANHKQELPVRFSRAIDRAAMRAGKGSSHAYLADWRRETRVLQGDPEAAVTEEISRLQDEFPPERLELMVRAGGVDTRRVEG